MDRKQLRTLTAVVEHRSFSAAARALGTVQSNVSAHVSRLEKELGVTLVDRATNDATAEGHAVLERARRIEAEFMALDSDLAFLRDVVTGSVRIGIIGTTARWLVPPLLRALWADYPEVRVVVLDAPSTSLVTGVISGELDMAVINLPVADPDLSSETLFTEDRLLVAPEGHPLLDLGEVSLVDLADHELLLEAPGTAFRDVLDAAAEAAGVRLRARTELDGMRLLASLAFAGFGAGIVPASAIPAGLGGSWQALTVAGIPGRTVGIIRRRRAFPSAAARVVGEVIRDAVQRESPRVDGIHLADAPPAHDGG